MPYNLKTLSDNNLKLLLAVMNSLSHKTELAGKDGPIKIGNAPKGVSYDEQHAILSNLEDEGHIGVSENGQYIYVHEFLFKNKSFKQFHNLVQKEYNKRFSKDKSGKPTKPHYDEINGELYIQGFKIKIKKHDEDTKQNQLLRYIFITNSKNIDREFDFTEFPFDDVNDKKKFKEICRTACTAINRKVALQTQNKIPDFLEFNTLTYGFLKINPKYLLG